MAEAEVQVYPKRPNDWQESWAWEITRMVKELDSKMNLVLNQITTGGGGKASGNSPITPELEREVIKVMTRSWKMDRQTPDQRKTTPSLPTRKSPPKAKQSKPKPKGKVKHGHTTRRH